MRKLFASFFVTAACAVPASQVTDPPPPPSELDGGWNVGEGGPDAAPWTGDQCHPGANDNGAVNPCDEKAPPESFKATLKWRWPATDDTSPGSIVLPLVGNFTDDDKNGAIDLCDTPDVLVNVAQQSLGPDGKLVLLSGKTGELEKTFDGMVNKWITPAFGDIDGDGLPEVVASDTTGHVVAYEHDGKLAWTGNLGGWKQSYFSYCHAFAIYNLDGDGNPEILGGFEAFDNKGKRLFGDPMNGTQFPKPEPYFCPTPTAADLDGDGKLEVIFGHQTYHSDGTLYWDTGAVPGQPHVANVDSDPEPEVIITTKDGVSIYEHDGKKKYGPLNTGGDLKARCWGKPGAIHDYDGDGVADFGMGSCVVYSMFNIDQYGISPKWTQNVLDLSGLATGTAFDFLGLGYASAIYSDENNIYSFDGKSGNQEMKVARNSGTLIEYPVVADVDNDHSADIVLVANYMSTNRTGTTGGPVVMVFSDEQSRWIGTRRIWNQHAYSVVNVREDGTIPKQMAKSWKNLNTFRANAQIGRDGATCQPQQPK